MKRHGRNRKPQRMNVGFGQEQASSMLGRRQQLGRSRGDDDTAERLESSW